MGARGKLRAAGRFCIVTLIVLFMTLFLIGLTTTYSLSTQTITTLIAQSQQIPVEDVEASGIIDPIANGLTAGRVLAWMLGMITVMLIFVLAVLSIPRYHFLVDLGLAGILSGLPFVFFMAINVEINYPWAGGLNSFAESVLIRLGIAFLIVFIMGIVSFIFGILGRMRSKIHNAADTKEDTIKSPVSQLVDKP